MASQDGTGISRLAKMQMKFQQKQLEEREQRRMELASTKAQLDETTSLNSSFGRGKVRQMFDERRRGTGIDKSYPLKPIVTTRSTSGAKTTSITTTSTKTSSTNVKKSNGRLNNTIRKSPANDLNVNNTNNNIGVPYGNNNNNNSTKILLNKHPNNIDDETFPDIDNSEIFGSKLPNVGKLASLSLDDKTPATLLNNGDTTNGIQHKNNIKLKPIAKKPLKTTVKTITRKMTSTIPDNMVACTVCNRHFNTDRIEKHEQICKKTGAKQRKQFDASLHRVKGTEAENFVRRIKGANSNKANNNKANSNNNINKRTTPGQVSTTSTSTQGTKKPSWKQKHEEFIEAIRAAKKVQQHLARGGKLSDLPPPPPSENPDYIQCPHCSRRFNEAAATRHIPKCSTMLHNKPKPGSKPSIASKSNLSRPAPKTGITASPMLKR